jgi:hypothetical protein
MLSVAVGIGKKPIAVSAHSWELDSADPAWGGFATRGATGRARLGMAQVGLGIATVYHQALLT